MTASNMIKRGRFGCAVPFLCSLDAKPGDQIAPFRPKPYWLDPWASEAMCDEIPAPVPQTLPLREIYDFVADCHLGALRVGEIQRHLLARLKWTFGKISDTDMRSINIAMTNYIWVRLRYLRGGVMIPDLDPGTFFDHTRVPQTSDRGL